MKLKEIKGLKYPDEYFIKFFFKNMLYTKSNLKILEFGSGNGNNLMLPYQYNHEVIGVDYNKTLIEYAKYNFKLLKGNQKYNFFSDDIRMYADKHKDIYCDVLSLPNIINYIPKINFIHFLDQCSHNKLYKDNADFFIRFRTPRDFRYGLGKRIDSSSYQIEEDNDMTGEKGALNCFYTETEMIDILREHLSLSNFKIFHIDFENLTVNGDIILDSDIVIWGKIN